MQAISEAKGNSGVGQGNMASSAAAGGGGSLVGLGGMTGAGVGHNSENLHRHKNGLGPGGGLQKLTPSDGEDDLDDLDDDESPDSRSLGSTSEQSLTSPAGFSSLNSLGSPASIASPSTPSGFEAAVSQADLFRPSVFGAFKPPSTSACSTGGGPGLQGGGPPGHYTNHHQMLLHQQHQAQMFGFRPPVGTDPRDSKNPLSISQLTGVCSAPGPVGMPGHHPTGGPVVGGPPGADKRALPLMT